MSAIHQMRHGVPQGVSVRKSIHDPVPPRPRSLLERAADMPDLAQARGLVCNALGLDPASKLAALNLSAASRWARVDRPTRLMELASWLYAECYEAMDLVECDPIDTRGD